MGEIIQEDCSEKRKAGSGLGSGNSAVHVKDTQRKQPECQRKSRKGWCPRGKGTESCKEGGYTWSDSREGNWNGTKKGPLVLATWRPLVGLADGVPVR